MLDIAFGAGSYRLEPAGATRVGALQRDPVVNSQALAQWSRMR
jgi:hypothetical protein